MAQGLRIEILGPVRAWRDGRELRPGPPRQQAVLAVLALRANLTVSRDGLIDAVWGEDAPASAAHAVHVYVSRLRKALEPNQSRGRVGRLLVSEGPGYLLRLEPGQLDLSSFERCLAEAEQRRADGDPAGVVAAVEEALRLWRGTPLEGIPGPFGERQRARLAELQLAAVEHRVAAMLDLGRHGEVVAELAVQAREQPLRERRWALLMLALYRCGRQADALAAFGQARSVLVEHLGVEPGPELQQLQQRILAADPALVLKGEPVTVSSAVVHTAGVPRQLPADLATFTGREGELRRLVALLTPAGEQPGRPATVVISAIDGMGGIGKSALAIRAAHQLADRFPDGQLYVNLHGATSGMAPMKPLEPLGRMLRALGLDPAKVPADLDEATALLRSLVEGRHLLMVLDNAADAAQVRPLLPASPTCGVLVTSRQVLATLDGTRPLHLDVLPHDQALALLAKLAGPERVAADPEAADQVVRRCGYLPLAIRITAARLAARPGWPVRELADRLADAGERLEELQAGDLCVWASFEVSLQALQRSPDPVDQAAARAYGLLSLPDGPDLEVAAAARLLDQPEPATQRLLERLVDAQLLQGPQPRRYQFHDLLRLHAREHTAEQQPEAERMAALTRLVAFYTATAWHTLALLRPGDGRLGSVDARSRDGGLAFADTAAALAWLEAERPNLLAAIAKAAASTPAVPASLTFQLTRALYGFFLIRSYWTDGAQANHTVLELARRIGDRAAQAHAHNDLGAIHQWLGRYHEMIACQHDSLVLFQELGDRHGQAACLNNLGVGYERLGRYQEALSYHQDGLALCQELGDRHGQAACLNNLGIASRRLGRYQEALSYHQDGLSIYRELGDRHGQGLSLGNLGTVYEHLHQYQPAVACYLDSLAIDRELADRLGEAYSLNNLGRVYGRLGHHRQACAYQQGSLAIRRVLGDRHGQAEALRDLGDALLGLGRHQQARQAWQEALTICDELRVPEADELRDRLASLPSETAHRAFS